MLCSQIGNFCTDGVGSAPATNGITLLLFCQSVLPTINIGLTETCVLATFTSAHDIWHGSSGSVLPGCQLRLVGPEGGELDGYDHAGEVLFKSPNLFIGYLGDEEATKNAFDTEGWLRTGDVGLMRVGPNGTEHLFIKDRLKDMIKVKVSCPSEDGHKHSSCCLANRMNDGVCRGTKSYPPT